MVQCVSCEAEIGPQCESCIERGFPICVPCLLSAKEDLEAEEAEAEVDDGSDQEEW